MLDEKEARKLVKALLYADGMNVIGSGPYKSLKTVLSLLSDYVEGGLTCKITDDGVSVSFGTEKP